MQVTAIKDNGRRLFVVLSCVPQDAVACRGAGFAWEPAEGRWSTVDPAVAARLAQYADFTCQDELQAIVNGPGYFRAVVKDIASLTLWVAENGHYQMLAGVESELEHYANQYGGDVAVPGVEFVKQR